MYVLGAILALGLLIIVHEAGHFFVGRWCGMRIERFSLGFGPGLLRWRSKKGTLFQVAPVPFGGFVEIKGMNIAEDVDPDDKEAYPNRPVWQRIATIFAGPGTNYLAAVVLAFGLYTCAGIPGWSPRYEVAAVDPKAPAAGILQPGDVITKVNDQELWLSGPKASAKTLGEYTNEAKGTPMTLTIERRGQVQIVVVPTKEVEVKNAKGETTKIWRMGIALETRGEVGVGTAAKQAVLYPWLQTKQYVGGLYGGIKAAIQGEDSGLSAAGPIGIGSEFKKAFELGIVDVIELLMLLNVVLAIMNLLPLPALDGGRLAFLGYELVTRRRANPRIETMVHMVGILVLMVVMVLVTWKDVARLF